MKPIYKRMIDKMQENEANFLEPWHVYIVECADGTYYTGVTNDVEKRIEKHNTGKGARYTRTRGPVKLVYREKCKNKSEALMREYKVKALPRTTKIKLIVKNT